MARKDLLVVKEYPRLVAGRAYSMRVKGIKVEHKAKHIRVSLEHLDRSQEGRSCELVLSLPVRPLGRTAEFFRACGFEISTGTTVPYRDAVGRGIIVTFGPSTDGGPETLSIDAVKKE